MIFAPQVALMFVGAIHDEVLAVDGHIQMRPAMHISIAYDHRGDRWGDGLALHG